MMAPSAMFSITLAALIAVGLAAQPNNRTCAGEVQITGKMYAAGPTSPVSVELTFKGSVAPYFESQIGIGTEMAQQLGGPAGPFRRTYTSKFQRRVSIQYTHMAAFDHLTHCGRTAEDLKGIPSRIANLIQVAVGEARRRSFLLKNIGGSAILIELGAEGEHEASRYCFANPTYVVCFQVTIDYPNGDRRCMEQGRPDCADNMRGQSGEGTCGPP